MTSEGPQLSSPHPHGQDLLVVEDLSIKFNPSRVTPPVVRGIDLHLEEKEIVGVVGESGAGKTVTALGVLGLLPPLPSCEVKGRVLYKGKNLLELPPEEMRRLRGRHISMVFQDPKASLNPVFRVGDQIAEMIRFHQGVGRMEAAKRAEEALFAVGVRSPKQRARQFPHELSLGLNQRALIAMALACSPAVLLADEPTSALDATTETRILDLLSQKKEELGMGVVLITHDLRVMERLCTRAAVLYSGEIVEEAEAKDLLDHPAHPYTHALVQSLPSSPGPLTSIKGDPPDPSSRPPGCVYEPRCPKSQKRCRQERPLLRTLKESSRRRVRCHFPLDS